MRSDDALCDRKPEAGSFALIGAGSIASARAHELFEHAGQGRRGNTWAIVGDAERNRLGAQ